MSRPRHMSLCTGYGGIDMALEAAFDAQTVAVADIDKGACKILAHRYPDAPNLGDITAVDWSAWAGRVDIISGGTPCQDLSHAGRRAGMTEGTRSNLWVAMREAIATIRPSLVVWENVRGAYSAEADSALEHCPRCVGNPRERGPVLRALGRVLGDLSELGYDAAWYGLRASDVGAAHHRFRVFVFAWSSDLGAQLIVNRVRTAALIEKVDGAASHRVMFPTPRAGDGTKGGPNQRGSSGDLMLPSAAAHLPTPMTTDAKCDGPADPGSNSVQLRAIGRALPTPAVADVQGGRKGRSGSRSDELLLNGIAAAQDWREYEPAIRRQEATFGTPAPLPTEPGRNGKPRLSPRFSEWLMGLPAGWITDTPGITRNEALTAAGNGVVPQQCYAAAIQFAHDFARMDKQWNGPLRVQPFRRRTGAGKSRSGGMA